MANTEKESIDSAIMTGNVVVGTTAVMINAPKFRFMKGIMLHAPGEPESVPNAAVVYLGNQNVTADTHAETGGFPLAPGSSLFIPSDILVGLHVVSPITAQLLSWIGI